MSYEPLNQSVPRTRQASGSAKRSRATELASPSFSSPSSSTRSSSQRADNGTPGLESELGTPTPSTTPLGKRRRVERGSSVASSFGDGTERTPRKRGGTVRQSKMLEKREMEREKLVETPTRIPIARKVKEVIGKKEEVKLIVRKVPVVEVEVPMGRGERMEARKRKLELVAMELDDEGQDSVDELIVTKVVREVEDEDEVEVIEVPAQEMVEELEVGMFGRIVRWFGLGR